MGAAHRLSKQGGAFLAGPGLQDPALAVAIMHLALGPHRGCVQTMFVLPPRPCAIAASSKNCGTCARSQNRLTAKHKRGTPAYMTLCLQLLCVSTCHAYRQCPRAPSPLCGARDMREASRAAPPKTVASHTVQIATSSHGLQPCWAPALSCRSRSRRRRPRPGCSRRRPPRPPGTPTTAAARAAPCISSARELTAACQ